MSIDINPKPNYTNEATEWFSLRTGFDNFVIELARSSTREQPRNSDHLAAILSQYYWDMYRLQIEGSDIDAGLVSMLYSTISDIDFYWVAEAEAWELYTLYRENAIEETDPGKYLSGIVYELILSDEGIEYHSNKQEVSS
tara:strand:+ start:197 stop:616 length:420 start_codon:yes stop_codon:yes gene_type:complete